jgi:hypothetical protein
MSSIALEKRVHLWLFRLYDEREDHQDTVLDGVDDSDVPGIRCPLCKWRPKRSDVWTCWDCDFPEYFYGACGTDWNTFETHGICPTCLHQWQWTSCYNCFMWSRHEDWYEDGREN